MTDCVGGFCSIFLNMCHSVIVPLETSIIVVSLCRKTTFPIEAKSSLLISPYFSYSQLPMNKKSYTFLSKILFDQRCLKCIWSVRPLFSGFLLPDHFSTAIHAHTSLKPLAVLSLQKHGYHNPGNCHRWLPE